MADEMTPQEKIAKLAAMPPEEFNAFMRGNFNRLCKLPLPESSLGPPPAPEGGK